MNNIKFTSAETENEFYAMLRKRVNEQFSGQKIAHADWTFWAKGGFWFFISYFSYFSLFNSSISYFLFWLCYAIFSLAGLLIGFSWGHDASHDTAFKNKNANQVLHFISFMTVGIDPLLWGLRHIRSHHIYANVEGSDIDIDRNPFLRLSPLHPWQPKHRYQAWYAPFVYMIALIHSVFWSDWVYLIHKDYAWMRLGVPPKALWVRFLGFKVVYFTLALVLPILFTQFSIAFILFTYLSTGAICSLLFVVMLVGTHFFLEADYPNPVEDKLPHNWAVHQLNTSCDWNAGEAWSWFISGGANCHAAHHLFPHVCHSHYSKINPIIESTTKEYDIKYHHKTLWEMMFSHFKHLNEMGKNV